MADLRSHCKKWLYVGKQDEQEYGPYTSNEMLHWLNNSYFDGSLRLRTTNDIRFYTLSEWVQACGNEIPFTVDVQSMDSLRSTANSRNYRGAQPTIDNVQQVDPFFPRPSITPASTVENADFDRQQLPLGMPIQLLPASQKTSPSSQQVLLMSAQPPPNQPLVLPVSSVPTYQFVQQHMFPSMSHCQQQPLMPIRLQPSSILHHQLHNQQAEQSQDGTMVSDSPDSGHVVTPSSYPIQQIGTGIDCIDLTQQQQSERLVSESMDGSWKRGMMVNEVPKMVDNWTSMKDDMYFQHSKGSQTEDISVKVSHGDAERLLFQLLGIRIRINFATEK